MPKYIKKTIVQDAFKWNEFSNKKPIWGHLYETEKNFNKDGTYISYLITIWGKFDVRRQKIKNGDYIILGENNEVYACDTNFFEMTYELYKED